MLISLVAAVSVLVGGAFLNATYLSSLLHHSAAERDVHDAGGGEGGQLSGASDEHDFHSLPREVEQGGGGVNGGAKDEAHVVAPTSASTAEGVPPRRRPTGRHMYLTTAGESVTVMDDLCVAANGSTYTIPQPTVCGWTFGASGSLRIPLKAACAKKDDDAFKYLKISPPVVVPHLNGAVAPPLKHRVHLGGETVFLTLAQASTNLAHLTGSMTHLFHVLRHATDYGLAGRPNRVIIVVNYVASHLYEDPTSFAVILLRAAVGGGPIHLVKQGPAFPLPVEPPLGDLAFGGTPGGGPVVTVVLNNRPVVDALIGPDVNSLCMQRAVLTNFPRGRWFIPSGQRAVPSALLPRPGASSAEVHQAVTDATVWRNEQVEAEGNVPADATPFRAAVFAALSPPLKNTYPTIARRLTYLIRHRRRAFDEPSEERFQAVLALVAERHGLVLDVVNFGEMSFTEQLNAVLHSAVLVGVHGANLVNTMYAPPGAELIEIFPYHFSHNMYERGGESGLGYSSVSLEEKGQRDFEGINKYPTVKACMEKSIDCKVWYRADERALMLSDGDVKAIEVALEAAIGRVNLRLPQP